MMIFVQVLRTGLSPKYIFFSKSNTFLMKDIRIYLKLEKKTYKNLNLFQWFKLKSSLSAPKAFCADANSVSG